MSIRNYSSTAAETTLQSGINNVSTVILVASTLGFPAAPFTLALDYGAAIEELVDVTAVAGLSLTVTRAVDGTSATTHGAGAKVRHVSSARDFREANDHINASSGVHGITGSVVGTTDTQTLKSKTLEAATAAQTAVTIKGAPGQTEQIVKVVDSTNSAVTTVSPTGFFLAKAGQFAGLPTGTTLRAQAGTAGGVVFEALDNGGLPLLVVNSTSIGTGIPFDSFTTDLASGALLTASAGWSISALTVASLKGGMLTLNGTVTRTGANITIDAAGAPSTGITSMATINTPYRPRSTLGVMYFHGGNSIATGTVRINTASTGVIELVRWQASQTITTGNAISFTMVYPIT